MVMKQFTDSKRKTMAQAAVRISKRTREALPDEIYAIAGEPIPTRRRTWRTKRTTSHALHPIF